MIDELWMISRDGLAKASELFKEAKAGHDPTGLYPKRQKMAKAGKYAVVDVSGILLDNMPPKLADYGFADYRAIRADIAKADQLFEEGQTDGTIVRVDSPGGMARGMLETAEALHNAKAPTVAYCDGVACSAAYGIASQADGIAAMPSAVVGNIGTILTWMDWTGLWDFLGVKPKAIVNEGADLKSTFHLEPDEIQLEFLQEHVDELGQQFKELVMRTRGDVLSAEVFRAGWYSGKTAQALGLIDGQADPEDGEALAALASNFFSFGRPGLDTTGE